MKFHSPFVCFLYHELKWIIKRKGSFSLCSRKPLTPGFKRRWVKCIRSWSHLHNNCIHTILLMKVKLTNKISLLAVHIKLIFLRPVNVIDCGNPDTPELLLQGQLGSCKQGKE